MKSRRSLPCLLVLVLAWSRPVWARGSEVGLQLQGCDELSEGALREHLEIELSTLGLSRLRAQLALRCEAGTVTIELENPDGTRYPITSRVDLRDTARPARERLLALAASELLAQAERAARETSGAASPAPHPATPLPAAARDVAPAQEARQSDASLRRVELALSGSGVVSGRPNTWLWGGALAARWGQRRGYSIVVDTQFQRGRASLPLADVRWTVLSGFAGGALGTELGPLRLSAGLGLRAGWITLEGEVDAPDTGQSLTAPWAGPALPLRVAFDTGAAVLPFVAGEAGYVALPVRGHVEHGPLLIEQRGPWLGASVGVAVEL